MPVPEVSVESRFPLERTVRIGRGDQVALAQGVRVLFALAYEHWVVGARGHLREQFRQAVKEQRLIAPAFLIGG